MTNNDILRRIRYIFDFNDSKMIAVFGLADHKVTRAQVSNWLKKEDDSGYQECSDIHLAIFLNGLIIDKRGEKEGSRPEPDKRLTDNIIKRSKKVKPQPEPEKQLTNNIIFMKLKIALNLKADDVLEILDLTNFRISKHELSAFFRKPGHKHYRDCKDQIFRNFLKGMQLKYRPNL